jgi:hypothetical protein
MEGEGNYEYSHERTGVRYHEVSGGSNHKHPRRITEVVEDESIFVHDMLVRRKWASEETSSSSNDWITSENLFIWNTVYRWKTILRQYNTFKQYTFLEYLKELQSKFHK